MSDEQSAALIQRVWPAAKAYLIAVGVLVVAAITGVVANSYTSLPGEVFTFGGMGLAALVLLRWAVRTRRREVETA